MAKASGSELLTFSKFVVKTNIKYPTGPTVCNITLSVYPVNILVECVLLVKFAIGVYRCKPHSVNKGTGGF